METLERLQRRIDTTGKLKSIVRTMKALAAVSIRQYEKATVSLQGYSRAIELGFQIVLNQEREIVMSATAASRQRTGVIIFGSDQGMCGALNDRICGFAVKEIAHLTSAKPPATLLAAGAQISSRLSEAGLRPTAEIRVPGSVAGITSAVQEILLQVESWQSQLGVDQVALIYSHHLSRTSSRPECQRLLPLDESWLKPLAMEPWPSSCLPTFSMKVEPLFSALVRQHLFISIYRALAESLASENASRLASMRRAEQNIDEQLADLKQKYHQQRQTAVTEELLDITTAFEALGSSSKQH